MAESLKERIREDLNRARREHDRMCTVVLTTLLSDIRNREIEVGHDLSDDEVETVIAGAIKRRREAADQMREGGRAELADKEMRECGLLEEYMPPPLLEEEVREMVRRAIDDGADDLGAVMGRIMPQVRGRFEGREANRIVREELERA